MSHSQPSAVTPHVNMADVARAAGVSVATVSRALREVGGVSGPTRAHVRGVAEDLAYVVSPQASGLARRTTSRVAVVVPRLDVWFYATMLAAVEEELRSAGLDMLVYQVDGSVERRQFLQQLPARRKVDAVIMIALPLPPSDANRLDLLGVHVVVAGGKLGNYPCVRTNDRAIACAAVEHLVGLGHERIAMIRTNDTDGTRWAADVQRTRGYRATLRAHRIESRPEYLTTVAYDETAGAVAMHGLLELPEPPTAVFAYSDDLALGALSALRSRGLDTPGAMSLIGVDGHPTSAQFGIDTVDQSVELQGRSAARMTVALLAGEPLTETEILTPWTLVERGSTGPPRSGALPQPK